MFTALAWISWHGSPAVASWAVQLFKTSREHTCAFKSQHCDQYQEVQPLLHPFFHATAGYVAVTATAGSLQPVAAPELSAPVQELVDKLLQRIAARDPDLHSYDGFEELRCLEELDQTQPGLLAWHVLPQLRPHLSDMDGPVGIEHIYQWI
jgi:hypothetical protein